MDHRLRRRQLPDLEARLKAARAEQHRRAISRHLAAVRSLYPRLKAANPGSPALQAEAIKLRDAAIAEIGEAAATINLPVLSYRGLLLEDLVRLWSDELDRVVFGPAPQPRILPVLATITTSKTTASKPTKPPRPAPAPATRPKRPPRQAARAGCRPNHRFVFEAGCRARRRDAVSDRRRRERARGDGALAARKRRGGFGEGVFQWLRDPV